jgi:glycosyltransferase involved in cell wall biosynthesis
MSTDPSRRGLRILHVAQTAQGGIGSYLEEIVALQVQRHGTDSVRVVLPEEHAVHFPGMTAARLLPFRTSDVGRLGSSLRMAVQAMRAVRGWQPDIVHLHSTFAGSVMRPLLALMPGGPKVIYCAHGWAFDRKIGPLQARLIAAVEQFQSNLCTAVVCVSQNDALRGAHIGIPAKRLKVVVNGIADAPPVPREQGDAIWPKDCLRVLFVGRLDCQKGVDILFSAMEMLGDRAFAIVAGSAVVADFRSALVPPPNVRVAGWIDRRDIAQLYASADLLAMPSRWEGLPLAALEAMRASLPVVASRVGGLPELIQDGISGRVVDAEDASQLAAAIASMDGPHRATMGARARQRFLQAFQIDRVVEELDHVYRTAVGQRESVSHAGTAHLPAGMRPLQARDANREDARPIATRGTVHREMRILHVAQTAHGGVGSYLEEILALQVQRHGADSVRVVLPEEHAMHFPGMTAARLLPFRTADVGRLGSSLRMAVQAMRAIRSWQPDIVHLHSTFAGSVMRPLLALMPGAPKVIYCAHGWAFDRKTGPLRARLFAAVEQFQSNLCTAVVCVSQNDALRAAHVGIPARRLKVVVNGIADSPPVPREQGDAIWPKDRLRVLFVGRLDYAKGADVLFSAMKTLGDSAFAVVAGSAVLADYKSALVPPDNVRCLGWMKRRDIAQLYASADLLVMPSRWEGMPLAALEAMRAGLPVVASRVGGLKELVLDGIVGRLVEPENPQELAAAMASMNGAQRAAMGVCARQRFLQAFQIDRVVEELELVYRAALGLQQRDVFSHPMGRQEGT